MRTEQFDYDLPEELIAATPAARREESRLLVLDRETGDTEHRQFHELPEYLRDGDVLVVNDARVVPARLQARRDTGGKVEVLLVHRVTDDAEESPWPARPEADGAHPAGRWLAMLRAGGKLREGETIRLEQPETPLELLHKHDDGSWTVRFDEDAPALSEILTEGSTPLPPYITRARRKRGMPEQMPELDGERYQTVFAGHAGAVAAPTAGLHFSDELLEEIERQGVTVAPLTLLVGPGTFRPVRTEHVENHELEAEFYRLPGDTARAVKEALDEGRRVISTGTTSCRVLEYVARHGRWEEHTGWTNLFIYPPFEFRVLSGLITNFHLPQSTLLMLVSAFAGRENVLSAYEEARDKKYRFYSYGDATLLL